MMDNSTGISVILVNWNTKKFLRDCLTSLELHCKGLSYEIYVVDNASSDGSTEMVAKEFPRVKLIQNKENLGFAKTNNIVIRRSKGRYVLLLNPDTLILDGALQKMLSFMEEHPEAGAVGCKHLDEKGNQRYLVGGHLPTLPWCLFSMFGNIFPVNGDCKRNVLKKIKKLFCKCKNKSTGTSCQKLIREVDLLDGCGLLIRRETIDEVGVFNENYFLGSEDAEWCKRAKKTGWKLWFLENIEIVHYGLRSYFQSKNAAVYYHQGEYQFLKDHCGKIQTACFRITTPFFMIAGILTHGILWSVTVKKHRTKLVRAIKNFWEIFKWSIGVPLKEN